METTIETVFLVEHNGRDGSGWWIYQQFDDEDDARKLYGRRVQDGSIGIDWRLAKTTVTKQTEYEILSPTSTS